MTFVELLLFVQQHYVVNVVVSMTTVLLGLVCLRTKACSVFFPSKMTVSVTSHELQTDV